MIDQAGPTTRLLRRPALFILCVVTVIAWAPLAGVLAGAALSSAFDCRVDEGSVHPCVVGGIDLGSFLNLLTVSGWLMLGLWPVMLLTLVVWLGLLVWAVVRRFRFDRA